MRLGFSLSNAALAGCLALLGVGCSATKRAPIPTDCGVLDNYELSPNSSYNNFTQWFKSDDHTLYPNGATSVANYATEMLDPDVCGNTQALLFTSSGNHDWGSLIGNYVQGGFQATPEADKNASAYSGLSFWARSSYDRSFAMLLGDDTSTEIAPPAMGNCVPQYKNNDKDAGVDLAFYGPGGVPIAAGCGNPFQAQIFTSDRWEFYTIPFEAFTQVAQDPRVKPDGINRASIYGISIRAPKDSIIETRFANFAWYRKKP